MKNPDLEPEKVEIPVSLTWTGDWDDTLTVDREAADHWDARVWSDNP